MGQSDVEWTSAFLDELKSTFGTGMWMADYAEDPDRARYDINDWVAEHTREHIAQLLPKGSITDQTRLDAHQRVWFQAPWPQELDDAGTKPFTTAAGGEVDASMLTTDGQLTYQEGDGWQSVALPYAGNDLGDGLARPRRRQAPRGGGRGLHAHLLDQVLLDGEPASVAVTFPRFDLDQRSAVGEALRTLGVTAPFDTETDFEPMTVDPTA